MWSTGSPARSEVRVTPIRTEIIIRATRTREVLADRTVETLVPWI